MPFFRTVQPRRRLAVALFLALVVHSSLGIGLAAGAAPVDGIRPVPRPAGVPAPVVQAVEQAEVEQQLQAALQRAHAHSGAPGLSMAVLTPDDRRWAGVSGTHANGTALAVDQPLAIGSVTKTFTAAIVLSLVDEGRIRLSHPASAYLPNAAIVRGVTVAQLLNHTSGIGDLYGPARHFLEGTPNRALSSNDVLEPIGRWFAPGAGYAYSNTNYYLLGHIIENVTGHSFNAELAQRFTGPLGLAQTRLLTEADAQLPAAWSTGFWTSGAMVSTPTELARWGRALYGGGLLRDTTRRSMLNFGEDEYGLGAQLLPLGRWKVPGHSGLLYTTTTLLIYMPARHITVAISGTRPHTDLEAALMNGYGGPSLFQVIGDFAD